MQQTLRTSPSVRQGCHIYHQRTQHTPWQFTLMLARSVCRTQLNCYFSPYYDVNNHNEITANTTRWQSSLHCYNSCLYYALRRHSAFVPTATNENQLQAGKDSHDRFRPEIKPRFAYKYEQKAWLTPGWSAMNFTCIITAYLPETEVEWL